ncbi:MAG: class I SAM-dependent methyltransferase, partial [Ardenticatenaceae bacterium]
DLGCGTGTNVLYLASHGWDATGVDYVERAIEQAQVKSAALGVPARFYRGDVTRLDQLPLDAPFDYVLDIGCLHSLTPQGQPYYAREVAHITRAGALYMLYAALPRKSSHGLIGIEPEQVMTLFSPYFAIIRQELGEDTKGGWARGWYWLRRAGFP